LSCPETATTNIVRLILTSHWGAFKTKGQISFQLSVFSSLFHEDYMMGLLQMPKILSSNEASTAEIQNIECKYRRVGLQLPLWTLLAQGQSVEPGTTLFLR